MLIVKSILEGKLWKDSQLNVTVLSAPAGTASNNLNHFHTYNKSLVICKIFSNFHLQRIMESKVLKSCSSILLVKVQTVEPTSAVNSGIGDSLGVLEAVDIQLDFEGKSNKFMIPQYSHILEVSNYLIACLVINQLQSIVPIGFRKSKYRNVSI